MRKTQKNLRLTIPLVERLEQEDDQSATVETALRRHFDDLDELDT